VKPPRLPVLLLLVGCAGSGTDLMYLSPLRWAEEMTKRGVDVREVPYPLATTDTMRETAERLAGAGTPYERLLRLQFALFDPNAFPFRYQARDTFTAAEAFLRRDGNCLSFTNLFVALGRSLDLKVTTGLVKRARASEKEGDLIIVNNHVVAAVPDGTAWHYFDFDRRPHERPTLTKPLNDLWITALYLNNKGADELRLGHLDFALRYFENALKLADDFAPTWGNVGVVRRRLGDISGALEAYRRALAISADDPTILGNLASLYRVLGREREAQMALAAANLSVASPHVIIVRGDLELTQGKIPSAIRLYKRARSLAPQLADPLVALARAELARKRPAAARTYVERALKLQPSDPDAIGMLQSLSSQTATR
jgi:tetratricopeptide (TPR) repeat protein